MRRVAGDASSFVVAATGDAGDSDIKLLDSASAHGNQAEQKRPEEGEPYVEIKKELCKQELEYNEFKEFCSQVCVQLRCYQDFDLVSRQLMCHLSSRKFSEHLQDALRKHQHRLSKLITLLAKCCQEEVHVSEWKKLTSAMKVIKASQNELISAGASFGYIPSPPKRRKITE